MINIICIGKIKENYLKELINDYYKRISKYHKIIITELKDNVDIIEEEKSLLKLVNKDHFIILLDSQGVKINSINFSRTINQTFIQGNSNIDFIIGGSNGVSSKIKSMSNLMISFGDVTFPHGLFRGILLEQIYRSFKIINHEEYHK